MTSTDTGLPPSLPPLRQTSDAIRVWNVGIAGVFLALSLWTLIADFLHQAHFLLQTSLSSLFLGLFVAGWTLLAVFFAGLPKRFVLGAVVLSTSRLAFGWPLLHAMDLRSASLLLDGLLVALGVTFLLSSLTDPALRLRQAFRWQHSLVMGTAAMLALILSLPVNYFALVEVIKTISHGYVRLSSEGVDLAERVFEKDGRRVHLVGMAHIGDGDFYDDLHQSLLKPVEGRRLVLLEGVTDSQKILPASFASGELYRSFAAQLGLVDQAMGFAARPEPENEDKPSDAWAEAGVDFQRADIDISELSPEHQERLVVLLSSLETIDLASMLALPDGMTAVDFEDLLVQGLLKQRNDRLMTAFTDAEADYAEVFIPWGAAHLPDLEKRLTGMGYRAVTENSRRIIDFWSLLRSS